MLDVAIDVLHHDDGVVDHEADSDGQRHQRQVVEAEMHQIHRRERAGERQRHRHARNERRPEIAQEQKDHQHHQADGEQQREFDVQDRGADGDGAVENGFDLDRRRDARRELRQFGLDLVDGVDDVGAGLLEYRKDDAVAVVLIGGDGAVRLFGYRLADVAHPDRGAVAIGQHHVVELLRVGDLVVGGDGEGDLVGVDHALGRVGRRRHQRAADFLERDAA